MVALLIPLHEANLLALVLESVLYGKGASVNPKLLGTVITMFRLTTAHLCIVATLADHAFLDEEHTALIYYSDLSNPLEVAKIAVFNSLLGLTDTFLIYRTYVVWGHQWLVAFPLILLLLGTLVSGFASVWTLTHAAPGAEVFAPAFKPLITISAVMTLATNILGTFLIACKIARTQWPLGLQSATASATEIIIESAAVYSTAVIAYMIAYLCDSNAQHIILDMGAPLIGITFTAIILRVSQGMAFGRRTSSLSSPRLPKSDDGGNHVRLHRLQSQNQLLAISVSPTADKDDVDKIPSAHTYTMEPPGRMWRKNVAR